MADPVSILILVAASELGTTTTVEMARAARDSLGERLVAVREAPPTLTDDAALDAERIAHASGVVEVDWTDLSHRRATLRVHLVATGRWVERTIGFMPSDPPGERGRTLGFAIVAILPETTLASLPPSAPPPSQPSAPPSPQAWPPPLAPPSAPAAMARAPSTTALPDTEGATVATTMPPPPSLAFDVLAVAALGGAADGVGAAAAVQWFALRGWALRLGALTRVGQIDAAEAHTASFAASAGVVLYPWRATPSRPFGASLRADYVLQRQSVTHFDADDPDPVDLARWISGFDLVADASWLFAPYVELVAGLGIEDVLATTQVNVRNHQGVATFPPLRGIGEAGLRLRF